MDPYRSQTDRIIAKLKLAKAADKDRKVFGASDHKYQIGRPLSEAEVVSVEQELGITLPASYRAFVTQVGDGVGDAESGAAGPFYGIDSLKKNVSRGASRYMTQPMNIYPGMSDDEWSSLAGGLTNDEDISDEDYQELEDKVFAGTLPLGGQGCTYYHAICLNGRHTGKVVNLDTDCRKPQFAFEDHYLDWYERWLDEVISGELIRSAPSWFGYGMAGSADELWSRYMTADQDWYRIECLAALIGADHISADILSQIAAQITVTDTPLSIRLIQILTKFSYPDAVPFLTDLSLRDQAAWLRTVRYLAEEHDSDWMPLIRERITSFTDLTTFSHVAAILERCGTDYSDLLQTAMESDIDTMRAQAYRSLGQCPGREDHVDLFITGLRDTYPVVIHATLQSLGDVRDRRLLTEYRRLTEVYDGSSDPHYILINLDHRLREYRIDHRYLRTLSYEALEAFANKQAQIKEHYISEEKLPTTKKWYEIWK